MKESDIAGRWFRVFYCFWFRVLVGMRKQGKWMMTEAKGREWTDAPGAEQAGAKDPGTKRRGDERTEVR